MKPILGNIPGILRPCTPVIVYGTKAIIYGPDDRPESERYGEWIAVSGTDWPDGFGGDLGFEVSMMSRSVKGSECEVDTSDATGRLHLAWWMRSHPDGITLLRCDQRAYRLYKKAIDGFNMTHEEQAQFVNFVLLLAARPSLAQTGEPT